MLRGIEPPRLLRTVEGDLGLRVGAASAAETGRAYIETRLGEAGASPEGFAAWVQRAVQLPRGPAAERERTTVRRYPRRGMPPPRPVPARGNGGGGLDAGRQGAGAAGKGPSRGHAHRGKRRMACARGSSAPLERALAAGRADTRAMRLLPEVAAHRGRRAVSSASPGQHRGRSPGSGRPTCRGMPWRDPSRARGRPCVIRRCRLPICWLRGRRCWDRGPRVRGSTSRRHSRTRRKIPRRGVSPLRCVKRVQRRQAAHPAARGGRAHRRAYPASEVPRDRGRGRPPAHDHRRLHPAEPLRRGGQGDRKIPECRNVPLERVPGGQSWRGRLPQGHRERRTPGAGEAWHARMRASWRRSRWPADSRASRAAGSPTISPMPRTCPLARVACGLEVRGQAVRAVRGEGLADQPRAIRPAHRHPGAALHQPRGGDPRGPPRAGAGRAVDHPRLRPGRQHGAGHRGASQPCASLPTAISRTRDSPGTSSASSFTNGWGDSPRMSPRAFSIICWGAAVARLGGADKVIVKTPHEAMGIPTLEANAQGLRATRQTIAMLADQPRVETPEVGREKEIIRREVDCLLPRVLALGLGRYGGRRRRRLRGGDPRRALCPVGAHPGKDSSHARQRGLHPHLQPRRRAA